MDRKLTAFLIRAKKATYAAKGPEAASSRPGSHDLHYTEGSLLYIDTYLGGDKFAGEEAIWENNKPIWAMNYVGRVTSDEFSDIFLRESLSLVPEEQPFRGPAHYKNGDYEYICTVDGDFHWYNGYEEIRKSGKKVYECYFHGGDII